MANENVNSICRVLDILECFTSKNNSWGVIELAQKLDLPASTVHRLMNTLVSRGYLAKSPHSKRYKPGSRLIWFSEAIISQYDMRNIARPYLEELAKVADETVHLCQLDHFDLFYVDKIETNHSVRCNSYMGLRIPAHASSAGKVLLAYQDEQEQRGLEASTAELREKVAACEQQSVNVKDFLKLVKSYTEPEQLTPEILHMFVDKIVVHEGRYLKRTSCSAS